MYKFRKETQVLVYYYSNPQEFKVYHSKSSEIKGYIQTNFEYAKIELENIF